MSIYKLFLLCFCITALPCLASTISIKGEIVGAGGFHYDGAEYRYEPELGWFYTPYGNNGGLDKSFSITTEPGCVCPVFLTLQLHYSLGLSELAQNVNWSGAAASYEYAEFRISSIDSDDRAIIRLAEPGDHSWLIPFPIVPGFEYFVGFYDSRAHVELTISDFDVTDPEEPAKLIVEGRVSGGVTGYSFHQECVPEPGETLGLFTMVLVATAFLGRRQRRFGAHAASWVD